MNMTDEELARRLTDAYDARLDREHAAGGGAHDAPLSDDGMRNAKSNMQNSAAGKEAQTIRAVPARRQRWRSALAAVLALCLLGSGLLLLTRLRLNPAAPEQTEGALPGPAETRAGSPAPTGAAWEPTEAWYGGTQNGQSGRNEPRKNYRAETVNGKTYLVMDREWEGDWELQSLVFPEAGTEAPWMERPASYTGGIAQLLDYGGYTALCGSLGLTQSYSDRNARYFVYAWAEPEQRCELKLCALNRQGSRVLIWLNKQAGPAEDGKPVGAVLIAPLDPGVTEFGLLPFVLNEFQWGAIQAQQPDVKRIEEEEKP